MAKQLNSYLHKVQYYETDQMGVVHHSNYIRWFEEARTELMDAIGFGYARMEEEGVIIPVLSVACEYKSMVKYGETVEIRPVIESFTGVRLMIRYEITDAKTGELRTTGESKHAFLNRAYRPVSLKKQHPEIYELLLDLMENGVKAEK